MGYFDPTKNTELHVDASPVGLGAILTHDQTTPGKDDTKVTAYASRSLTPIESRYSHIEKEALAIIYSVEYFRLYLYGYEFTLITDKKPRELLDVCLLDVYVCKNTRSTSNIDLDQRTLQTICLATHSLLQAHRTLLKL